MTAPTTDDERGAEIVRKHIAETSVRETTWGPLTAAISAALSAARREERERANQDTARLDFLDGLNARLNAHYGTTYRWALIINHNVNRLCLNFPTVDLNDAEANGLRSCRDAIDREMARIVSERRPSPPEERGG